MCRCGVYVCKASTHILTHAHSNTYIHCTVHPSERHRMNQHNLRLALVYTKFACMFVCVCVYQCACARVGIVFVCGIRIACVCVNLVSLACGSAAALGSVPIREHHNTNTLHTTHTRARTHTVALTAVTENRRGHLRPLSAYVYETNTMQTME